MNRPLDERGTEEKGKAKRAVDKWPACHALGSSGRKKERARERETREGSLLACLPLACPLFLGPATQALSPRLSLPFARYFFPQRESLFTDYNI